jgi:two-component system, NarL family, sensor histidine kinase DegS
VRTQRTYTEKILERSLDIEQEERRRISTELHDGLAQWITSASYAIQTGKDLLNKSDITSAVQIMDQADSIIRRSIGELRREIMNLHPLILTELGLVKALEQSVDGFSRETGISADFEVMGKQKHLTSLQEIAIYRVVTELLNNIKKHSRASRMQVKIHFYSSKVVINVADDGIGFDLIQAMPSATRRGSIGLVSMRERMDMVQGSLDINTGIGKGTRVLMTVPLSSESIREDTRENNEKGRSQNGYLHEYDQCIAGR